MRPHQADDGCERAYLLWSVICVVTLCLFVRESTTVTYESPSMPASTPEEIAENEEQFRAAAERCRGRRDEGAIGADAAEQQTRPGDAGGWMGARCWRRVSGS
jgi:hypothetical protein